MNKKYSENDHKYALRKANKIKAINLLGGKCKKCGAQDIFILEFHHENKNKESSISQILDKRFSDFIKEVGKCILLCSNCHAELHCDSLCKSKQRCQRSKNKKQILDLLKIKECTICGYVGNNFASLDFHHIDKNKKSFQMSKNLKEMTIGDLMCESKKCVVICKNCHKHTHSDEKRFTSLKELIYYKVKNHKEKPKEYDKEKIWLLYMEGKKQKEISKIIGCPNGTLSASIKRIKISKGLINNE
jgi:hypothetical protein